MIHHAHLGVVFNEKLTLASHYISTFTKDARLATEEDGSIDVYGVELRLVGGIWGEGFIGYSYTKSDKPLRIAMAPSPDSISQTAAGTGTVVVLAMMPLEKMLSRRPRMFGSRLSRRRYVLSLTFGSS